MTTPAKMESHLSLVNPQFESLVQRIIATVDKERLEELRTEFHTRLRITLSHPENSALIEDLWDFFYDWCIFEQKLPEEIATRLTNSEKETWDHVQSDNNRSLFTVQKINDSIMKLKDLYSGKSFIIPQSQGELVGISKGDILEGRIITKKEEKKSFDFLRKPSYHPTETHAYLKKKIKEFRKSKDESTFQNWLWLVVGMYLKHGIYAHMPIKNIYDDNSRI